MSIYDATGTNVIGFDDSKPNTNASHFRNVISGNGTDGIRISNTVNQKVSGNYIGTDATGTISVQNENYGIQVQGNVNGLLIGTDSDGDDDEEERNLISGNSSGFRFLSSAIGSGNVIAGNYIGTDVSGNNALRNRYVGMSITGDLTNMVIGTNADGVRDVIERNVISGNGTDGIRIDGADGVRVSGNYIGVGADGVTTIPNESRGIIIATSTSDCIIGYSPLYANSSAAEVGNVIRGNDDSGIAHSGVGTQNRYSRNSYGYNSGLAIDLDYDGVSANDNGDGDSGSNTMLNYPVLSYSKRNATTLRVRGFAPAGALIEFYVADGGLNPSPLPSGFTNSFGEGYTYLVDAIEGSGTDSNSGSGTYTDDGSGSSTTKTQQEFTFDIPIASLSTTLSPGMELTAIAIDATGNTSEFSGRRSVRFVEICNDLIDNDGDGFIDCDDEDCPGGEPVSTVTN